MINSEAARIEAGQDRETVILKATLTMQRIMENILKAIFNQIQIGGFSQDTILKELIFKRFKIIDKTQDLTAKEEMAILK